MSAPCARGCGKARGERPHELARSRPGGERDARRAGEPAGRDRVGVLPALRRGPPLLHAAARSDAGRRFRLLDGRAARLRPGRAGISGQHTDSRDPAVRPQRGRGGAHGFRSPFPPVWPRVLPMMLVRRVKRLAGSPRIRVRLRPARDYGRERPATTCGSNHIRYVGPDVVVRLTTDAPVTAVVEENAFFLEHAVTLLLGPDETVQGTVADVGTHFLDETANHWREWVRSLAIPFEWQDAVIRAAITLKLNVYEDTGAIIAAVTTSIPE